MAIGMPLGSHRNQMAYGVSFFAKSCDFAKFGENDKVGPRSLWRSRPRSIAHAGKVAGKRLAIEVADRHPQLSGLPSNDPTVCA